MSIREKIESAMRRIGTEQNKRLASITDDLPLLNSGLDSLSFALLVANLEDELGVDPFTESENIQAPVTFGDFVNFYENALKVERSAALSDLAAPAASSTLHPSSPSKATAD